MLGRTRDDYESFTLILVCNDGHLMVCPSIFFMKIITIKNFPSEITIKKFNLLGIIFIGFMSQFYEPKT